MLAMPAGTTLPQPLSCTAERCALGNCRRGGGYGDRADRERRLDDLIQSAAADPPDAKDLTAAILARLDAAGLLPADGEGGPGEAGLGGRGLLDDAAPALPASDHHVAGSGPGEAEGVRPASAWSPSMPVACAPSAVAAHPGTPPWPDCRDGRS